MTFLKISQTCILSLALGLSAAVATPEEDAKREQARLEQAKVEQAKKDVVDIVNAIKVYYSDYGMYPFGGNAEDQVFAENNERLFLILAGKDEEKNPRNVVYLKSVKPKDPWGNPYHVAIDTNYDNQIEAKLVGYSDLDAEYLKIGVAVWSFGKDGKMGTNGDKKLKGSDDIVSW